MLNFVNSSSLTNPFVCNATLFFKKSIKSLCGGWKNVIWGRYDEMTQPAHI